MLRREFLARTAAAGAFGLTSASRAQQPGLRVGVVGGGIVGASIAFHLAQAGARVTLFEKAQPASGATQNSFAWLNAFVSDAHYRGLRLRSLLAYHALDRRLRLGITWGGYLNWAGTAAEVAALRANAAQLDGTPYAVRMIDASGLAALTPTLTPGPVAAAFFSGLDGHLDPVKVTRIFLAEARRYGTKVLTECEVLALDLKGTVLTGVRTNCGLVPLDRLVVAAGVDTPAIVAMAGFTLKLRHAPGIVAHSRPTAVVTPIIYDGPGHLLFKQMANGSIVGSDAGEPPDIAVHQQIRANAMPFPDESLRAVHGNRILTKIGAFLPAARTAPLERLMLGFRPMPLDDLPVVGALPGAPSIHVVVTHSGVTLAPLLGQFVRDEVLAGLRLEALAPYRPERF
jgi:glycine/D-amino acid oxidase-like deaminating enzyme